MSSNDDSVRIRDYSTTSDQTEESIKNVAKGIRDSSSSVRELILALTRSGAIEEIARTILEATSSIRDTANEINDIVKDLKERGTITNIASAVEETTKTALDTIQIAKNATRESTNNSKK
jgi:methyl-accepting chemotaxis protein